MAAFAFLVAGCLIESAATRACTVFTLTDTNRTLFCNNEDWSAKKPKIWFVPSGKHFGCVYVGFVTQISYGGCNTEGLAFDWVAGYDEKWQRHPKQKIARGIPHERMLETCATVDDAIEFYKTHWEPVFGYAKMLVADRTGELALLGAHNGRFEVARTNRSGGFGFGGEVFGKMRPKHSEPTLTNAAQILLAARQEGKYATRYSNVFDLASGNIYLILPGRSVTTLNLAEELKKGPHRYSMSTLGAERPAKPKRLSRVMEWIKNICCPLRYSRPTLSSGS